MALFENSNLTLKADKSDLGILKFTETGTFSITVAANAFNNIVVPLKTTYNIAPHIIVETAGFNHPLFALHAFQPNKTSFTVYAANLSPSNEVTITGLYYVLVDK